MRITPPTLTYFAVVFGPKGESRRVPITLPHITCIADLPRYTAPPPEPEPLAFERAPRWSEKLIRRTLGKDRKRSAKLRNQLGYRAALRRIDSGGV